LRKKRIDEGLRAISEAQNVALTRGEWFWQAELLRLKGELLLEQGEPAVFAAEQCFAEAVRIAQEQHAKMLELRAATSLARLLRKHNRSDTAKGILNATLSQFGAQDADPDRSEAQTILDQLNAAS
jgi:predicted ATPase